MFSNLFWLPFGIFFFWTERILLHTYLKRALENGSFIRFDSSFTTFLEHVYAALSVNVSNLFSFNINEGMVMLEKNSIRFDSSFTTFLEQVYTALPVNISNLFFSTLIQLALPGL